MERNYHIFYMLAAGASAEQRHGWAMGDLKSHQFTSQSGCYDRRDGVLDSDLYKELIEAFQVMGFEENEKASSISTEVLYDSSWLWMFWVGVVGVENKEKSVRWYERWHFPPGYFIGAFSTSTRDFEEVEGLEVGALRFVVPQPGEEDFALMPCRGSCMGV